MTIGEMFLLEYDHEMAKTRKILERVPENNPDFKPHEKSMALSRLANHVAEMASWLEVTLKQDVLELDASQKPDVAATREDLLVKFDTHVGNARDLIATTSDEEFQKIWTMRFDGKEIIAQSRVSVVREVVMNHMIHHRAQLGVYLRLNDVQLPGLYGPSADEMQFWKPAEQQSSAAI